MFWYRINNYMPYALEKTTFLWKLQTYSSILLVDKYCCKEKYYFFIERNISCITMC